MFKTEMFNLIINCKIIAGTGAKLYSFLKHKFTSRVAWTKVVSLGVTIISM